MKRTLPAIVPALLSSLAFMLIVATALLPARLSAASSDKVVNVDYVIGLLDAGVDQSKIVDRIEQKGLTFRIAPGDMSRLRAAGAEDKLIDAVIDHAAGLEGQGGTGSKAGQEQAPPQETDQWGRPSRLGNPGGTGSNEAPAAPGQEQATPPPEGEDQQYEQSSDGNGQGIEEEPYGGSYGYYPGYYDFYYGYPYPYYSPYPYSAYFYYSYPYYHYYPRHYFYGGSARGGGGVRTAPRGGRMAAPHSSGGFHSAPRSHPRGSHH
ncbi:MAG: hypothetical protein AUH92_00705 [Acidobacteria bacterium 13_1_40CM_4_69_4]|nr:MAG: hypothetical protein AUH92_00705 [Acidobacteria bacterium 13_1_40CM_4_69_4]